MAEIVKCAKCGMPQPNKYKSGDRRYYCDSCGRKLNQWLNWLSYKIRTYEKAYPIP